MPPCPWAASPLLLDYHDTQWGVPTRDPRTLFEFLILEGAQAGLSWETILRKRSAYRTAFADFDPSLVARFSPRTVRSLLRNPGIVRNRLKIESAITNARAVLALGDQFSELLWSFVQNSPLQPRRLTLAEVPASSPQSLAMSKSLKKHAFRFVGPTTCYAFMQAVGMVNDHLVSCPRHSPCAAAASRP